MRPSIVVAAVVVCCTSGCGGKILVEPTALDAADAAPPEPVAVAPPSMTVEEACAKICERSGACGAWTDECEARCLAKASAGCGAAEWLRCYGERITGCLVLPPACEPAYCAWAACAGQPVPDYCH